MTQLLSQIGTVFIIAMENHNFTQPNPVSSPQQIYTNPAAPYINSLIMPGNSNAVQVSFATRYFNAGAGVHPSEPNYVWAEGGSDFGIHTDSDPRAANANVFTTNHLTRQLNVAGIPWKSYQEDLQYATAPTNSASGTSAILNSYYGSGKYDYAVKHNPMAFYNDTQIQNVYALTNFLRDLTNNAVGRYNWITPNQYNDAHSALSGGFTYRGTAYTGDQAAIAQGDNFLATLVPKIMASTAYQSNGVIIIWWDESEGSDTTNYTIPEIIISQFAKGNAYASTMEYSHSSDIKTVENIFGLPFLSNSIPVAETKATGGYNDVATVNDLSDMFQLAPRLNVQQPANSNLTNGVGTINFGTANLAASVTNIFTVTNSGLGTLNLTAMPVTGANTANFAVSGITLPAAIVASNTTTFKIIFTPSAAGSRSATLQITNNDVLRNPFTIALTGTGNAAPVVTVPSTITVEATNASGNLVSFTVTANDPEDGVLAPIVTPASGSTFPLGTNTVTATATDSHSVSATNTFAVIVRDTTPPVITLNGANPFTNFQTVSFVDPGATASDIVSGSVAVTTNSTVNVSAVGNYSVQYTASDARGNFATNMRTVKVVALETPSGFGGAAAGAGGFQLSFNAAIGQPYRVLGTDELGQPMTNWIVLASGIVTTNPVVWSDTLATTNAFRFYRIVSP